MPASTLHKSAQQEAPDAYIFHVQEHNQRHACTKKIHAPQLACSKRRVHLSCARPRDARSGHLMRALARYAHRPPMRAYKDARITFIYASKTYAHPPSSCMHQRWPHQQGRVQKMHASPSAARVAKMRASGQLQELRLTLHASVLPATFSPTI